MNTQLPDGYAIRPPTDQDLPALAALDAAHTRHAVGTALRTENEIRIEWKAPYFDLETDARIVVSERGEIVGWCEVYDQVPHTRTSSRLRLLPDADGWVAGWLLDWCIERARAGAKKAAPGQPVVLTQGAYEGEDALIERLRSVGFTHARSFLRMRIEMTSPPQPAEWPDGIVARTLVPGEDDRPVVELICDAFRDHWGYVEVPFEEELEEWKQWIHEDEDFDTDLWFLALDNDHEAIVGTCQCYPFSGEDRETGLVDVLGVRQAWRRRGLATAMLLHAFGAFYDRGIRNVELGVDSESPTGAMRLYERAGMHLAWTIHVYELELRAADEVPSER